MWRWRTPPYCMGFRSVSDGLKGTVSTWKQVEHASLTGEGRGSVSSVRVGSNTRNVTAPSRQQDASPAMLDLSVSASARLLSPSQLTLTNCAQLTKLGQFISWYTIADHERSKVASSVAVSTTVTAAVVYGFSRENPQLHFDNADA